VEDDAADGGLLRAATGNNVAMTLWPIVVVTDNGPAMKSAAVAVVRAAAPLRARATRHRSPGTNGVIERWFQALKYERLYRHDIADGLGLEDHVETFRYQFNYIRPHDALDWARPIGATYPQTPPGPGPSNRVDTGQLRSARCLRPQQGSNL
jgi:transposase InsO family protein